MNYIELHCELVSDSLELLSAYLITGLGDIGYESFDEDNAIVKAYIPQKNYNQLSLEELIKEIPSEFGTVNWQMTEIEQENWNAEWEKHFNPVVISNSVLIKASFHQHLPSFPYEIVINPKMSFGTGHHSTTALMIKTMIGMQFEGKRVLDMGCGTGVLAILAHQLGASEITAVDIDEWAVTNSRENFQENNITHFNLYQGGVESISGQQFDIVLANINRNILINDMQAYASALKPEGTLVISGIYHADLELVRYAAEQNNLIYKTHIEKNAWVSARFNHL